jgi:hypothetical protein
VPQQNCTRPSSPHRNCAPFIAAFRDERAPGTLALGQLAAATEARLHAEVIGFRGSNGADEPAPSTL